MQSFTHYLFPIVHADVCKKRKKTNLYLNLFLNISFVLIYLFCYNHATVIENIVYTRAIMYLVFAIFSIEMFNYHFDQIFCYIFGVMLKLVVCLVFLIAVLCSTFSNEKNIMSVSIT